MENAMDFTKIEEIQKKNAEDELNGWLNFFIHELKPGTINNVQRVKQALAVLSQTTKALRRHGHFLGLDKDDKE